MTIGSASLLVLLLAAPGARAAAMAAAMASSASGSGSGSWVVEDLTPDVLKTATATISGPFIWPSNLALDKSLKAKYGSDAKLTKITQTSTTTLGGVPGTVAKFSTTTGEGKARRYMVRQGASSAVGLKEADCSITNVQASRRRRLATTASSTVKVSVQLVASIDVSAKLEATSFVTNFASAYVAAESTVPTSITMTAAEKTAIQDHTGITATATTPVYVTTIELSYPASKTFDPASVTAVLVSAGVDISKVTVTIDGSATAAPTKKTEADSSASTGLIIVLICAGVIAMVVIVALMMMRGNAKVQAKQVQVGSEP